MMLRLIVVGLLMVLVAATPLHAQEDEHRVVVVYKADSSYFHKQSMLRLNLIAFGVGYEKVIASNITFYGEVGITYNRFRSFRVNSNERLLFYPNLRAEFRYFFDADRRIKKGKNIEGFVGTYVSGIIQYLMNPNFRTTNQDGDVVQYWDFNQPISHGIGLGIALGIQRRIGKHGYFGIEAGPMLVNTFLRSGDLDYLVSPNLRINGGFSF